jgi:hypothetical protein
MDNANTPTPHNLLTPLQRAFIQVFSQLPDQKHFFLTGGTALAEYYLGHRLSYDLDFFTSDDGLVQPVSFQIERLSEEKNLKLKVIRRFATYVEFLISDDNETLKVDLALDSPFRFQEPVFTSRGIWVNHYVDLCVDKLLAYYGRAELRDAVDLYLILESESSEVLIEKAKQKDPGFDLYWFAVALNRCIHFPDEPTDWPVSMLVEWDPQKIKVLFQNWAIKIMKNL